jgi:predicted DNA-binding protein YlxM (UPF0122 family)
MQKRTPAANSQDKFHISPQEASDFTNISHSKIYQKVKRTKKHKWTVAIYQLRHEKQTQPTKIAVKLTKRMQHHN